jgi:hypothetical protein
LVETGHNQSAVSMCIIVWDGGAVIRRLTLHQCVADSKPKMRFIGETRRLPVVASSAGLRQLRSDAMSDRCDHAKAYYWRAELHEPTDPDDDRYVLLHGDEGEIVGPMTMHAAEAWIDRFDARLPLGGRVSWLVWLQPFVEPGECGGTS